MANYQEEKQKLENELLQAQVQKAKLEADSLRKSPLQNRLSEFNEGIKVFGAIVLGIGGAIAGGQGVLYGVNKGNAEKAAVTANEDANTNAIKYKQELELVTQKYKAQTSSMKELQGQFDAVSVELENLRNSVTKLPASEGKSDLQANLAVLDSSVGHARIDLFSSNKMAMQSFVQKESESESPDPGGSGIQKSANVLIEEIFSPNSAVRAPAYSEFFGAYSADFEALKELIAYAEEYPNNVNGVYNTLVFLANARYKDMQQVDYPFIDKYLESIQPTNKRTEQRIRDVNKRLAKVSKVPLHAKPLDISEIVLGETYMIVPPASGFINAPIHETKPGLYLSKIIGELEPYEKFRVLDKWKTPVKGYNWLQVEHQVDGEVQTGWLPWGLRETPIVKAN